MRDTFKVISSLDTGIDSSRMPWETMAEYVRNRDYATIAPFVDNTKATIFTCREVPGQLWESFVMQGDGEAETMRRAFVCGVISVQNAKNVDGTSTPWSPTGQLRGQLGTMTDEECFERFCPAERAEIGSVIFRRSFLRPSTEHTYQLLPLLLNQLVHRTFLLADASQSDAAQSSAKPSDPSTANQDATAQDSGTAAAG